MRQFGVLKIGQSCNKTNKQNKRPFFLPKINSEPNFTKVRICFGHFLKKLILLRSRKRCHQEKSCIFSGSWLKTQNGYQNRIYPSLRLQHFSLLKGFKTFFSDSADCTRYNVASTFRGYVTNIEILLSATR